MDKRAANRVCVVEIGLKVNVLTVGRFNKISSSVMFLPHKNYKGWVKLLKLIVI